VRYFNAALVGLVGGFLLTGAVITVEFIRDGGVITFQMTTCADYPCIAHEWASALKLPVAFGLGFAAGFMWFLRPRRIAP
jgi:hypothetical protein